MFLKNYRDKVTQVRAKIGQEGLAKEEEETEELPFIIVNEH